MEKPRLPHIPDIIWFQIINTTINIVVSFSYL